MYILCILWTRFLEIFFDKMLEHIFVSKRVVKPFKCLVEPLIHSDELLKHSAKLSSP